MSASSHDKGYPAEALHSFTRANLIDAFDLWERRRQDLASEDGFRSADGADYLIGLLTELRTRSGTFA